MPCETVCAPEELGAVSPIAFQDEHGVPIVGIHEDITNLAAGLGQRGVCDCCESHWSDPRKKLVHYSLDKAVKILWHNRHCLFVRRKHVSEDKKLQTMEHLEKVKH